MELGEEKVLPVLFSAQVFSRLPRDLTDAVYLTAIRLIRKHPSYSPLAGADDLVS